MSDIPPNSAKLVISGDSFVSMLEDVINHYYKASPARQVMSLEEYAKDALKAPPEVIKFISLA